MMQKDDNSTISTSMIEDEEEEDDDDKPTARYRLANEFYPLWTNQTALNNNRRGYRYEILLLCFDYLRRGVTVYSSKPYRYRLSAYETTGRS